MLGNRQVGARGMWRDLILNFQSCDFPRRLVAWSIYATPERRLHAGRLCGENPFVRLRMRRVLPATLPSNLRLDRAATSTSLGGYYSHLLSGFAVCLETILHMRVILDGRSGLTLLVCADVILFTYKVKGRTGEHLKWNLTPWYCPRPTAVHRRGQRRDKPGDAM